LDPQSGDVRGSLHLSNGRVPIAATVGTVRQAKLDVEVANRQISANLTAKLGPGDITGTAKVAMHGATPTKLEFRLGLRKVSPVGAMEPVISADVAGEVASAGHWTGKVSVKHGAISIPSTERDEILDAGAPSDMLFVDAAPPIAKPRRAA